MVRQKETWTDGWVILFVMIALFAWMGTAKFETDLSYAREMTLTIRCEICDYRFKAEDAGLVMVPVTWPFRHGGKAVPVRAYLCHNCFLREF